MNDINQLIEHLLSIQQEADKKGLKADILKMYNTFYEQYKLNHNDNPEYLKIMFNVDNWVLAQINETIINKEIYNKEVLHKR